MSNQRHIYITEKDMVRLERLLAATQKTKNVLDLEEELGHAITVPAEKIPSNVVTMNSKVRFKDNQNGEESEVTLVYPQEANVDAKKVSVLAPVGSALLGLSVGQTIEWTMPTGKKRIFEITSILYQPEASGHFDL